MFSEEAKLPAKSSLTRRAKASRSTSLKVEVERLRFKALLAANPNYFGNLKESIYPVKKLMANNIVYEELKCVGFNPKTEYLETIIYIKKQIGYGGNVCSAGTKEYVRFFLSYDNGATWLDQGMTSFTAYDVPGAKPLEYSLRLSINPPNRYCAFENLPRVRAILSWNKPPTAGDPDFTPAYGNRLENNVQIGATNYLLMKEFLDMAKPKVVSNIAQMVDLEQQIVAKPVKKTGTVELAATYAKNEVQAHRLFSGEISHAVEQSGDSDVLQLPAFQGAIKLFKLDPSSIIDAYLATDGDTGYEELNCIGMCQGAIDWLTATFRIKRRYGYLGGLCSPGSNEYVAFWIDWGNGAGWTYAGTGAVDVYDLTSLPPGGVEYTVSIPVNTQAHRRPCSEGPKTARVRAILSWQDVPPSGNPDYIPRWGNREETLVLLKPGPAIVPQDNRIYVDSVANMAVCDIQQSTGLATGPGQIAAFNAFQSPFGGTVRITGFIINPPNAIANPAQTLKYRVSVRRLTDAGVPVTTWQPLSNDFDIVITEQIGPGLPVQYHHNHQIDGSGFYTYMEQAYTNQWRQVLMDKIASWETRGLVVGLWEIMVEVKLPDSTILPPGVISCLDGTTRSTIRIRLDEKAPSANIAITEFVYEGTTIPATSCGTFIKGGTIVGEYSTFDPESHWKNRTIHVAPAGPAHSTPVNITPTVSNDDGEYGNWSLDTSNMDPCGYIVYLWAEDRTIVDSGHIGWEKGASAGFCLKVADDKKKVKS